MKREYVATFALGFLFIIGWNAFIIKRDQELFKAYDACTHFTHHPDCPYQK